MLRPERGGLLSNKKKQFLDERQLKRWISVNESIEPQLHNFDRPLLFISIKNIINIFLNGFCSESEGKEKELLDSLASLPLPCI